MSIRSQCRTLLAPVIHRIRGTVPPPAVPWFDDVETDTGPVRLTGWLSVPPNATAVAILVHGLGGSADAHYAVRAASAAHAIGIATLRLSLRGADRRGDGIYHAGLTGDLHAAIAAEELASFDAVALLGYSLGGHTALLAATETRDPRVRAVAAIQPPLDLAAGQAHLDRTRFYRHYILRALRSIHASAVAHGRAAAVADVRRISTIREWDERVVAPHFGFRDAADYYARASVGPRLGALRVPALVVASRHDPLVPPHTIEPSLDPAGDRVDVRWVAHGGHGATTGRERLGVDGAVGLEAQVFQWLAHSLGD